MSKWHATPTGISVVKGDPIFPRIEILDESDNAKPTKKNKPAKSK